MLKRLFGLARKHAVPLDLATQWLRNLGSSTSERTTPSEHNPSLDIAAEWLRDLGRTTSDEYLRTFLQNHALRLATSLARTPSPPVSESALLELGCWGPLLPYFKDVTGYSRVAGIGYDEGKEKRLTRLEIGDKSFEYALMDVESDPMPFGDGEFNTVLIWELIEHLAYDPMFMMAQVNRVLKTGGQVFITTPNIASARSIRAILDGGQPQLYPYYNKRRLLDRHHIEYAPPEIRALMAAAGFAVEVLETPDVYNNGDLQAVFSLLKAHGYPTELRGDTMLVIGRKISGIVERYPAQIYE
jgi:SAM-dependent methyltransferase